MKDFSKLVAVLAVFMLLLSGCGKHDKGGKDNYKKQQKQQEQVKPAEKTETNPEVVLEEIDEESEIILEEEAALDEELDELESEEF